MIQIIMVSMILILLLKVYFSFAIVYANIDESAVASYPVREQFLDQAIHMIGKYASYAFNTTCPCAICGTSGHTCEGCKELEDPAAIQKVYIQVRIALGKYKENK